MKKMKKIFALLIAMVMVLCMSTVAFAETITIDGAVDGKIYTAYKLLDATYEGTDVAITDDTNVSYYYTGAASDELYTILAKYFQFDAFVDGKAYVKVVDDEGTAIDYSNVNVAALAAEINTAMERETDPLTLTAAGTATASGTTASISNLAKGYYFLDTTTGSLCSIDTAGKVTIYEKNSVPTVTDKNVKPDGAADTAYTDSINGTVGDKFKFKVTVNTGTNTHAPAPGTATGRDTDFVITDTLGKGFTLNTAASDFAIEGWTYGTDFTVQIADANDTTKDTTITITLKASKLATVVQNTDINILYDATLNENAITDGQASNSANNQTTITYTYGFEILKVDSANTPLENVKFTLKNDKNEYYFVPSDASSVDEDVMKALGQGQDGKIATGEDGKITFSGIAAGTYTLTETDTLSGYNLLDAPIIVAITPNVDDPSQATVAVTSGEGTASGNVITIVNQSGSVLPSTGGIGTTIFYIIGAILVIGAGVVLVTRRRMSANK